MVMWKMHGRWNNTGIDCMVIDQAIYSAKNDALDNFPFIMAIHTGQYAYSYLILLASLYVLFIG